MEALARALVALSAGALSGRHHLDELARRVEVAASTPRRATEAQRSTPASSPAERLLSAAWARGAQG